jgi:hypothetical protein
MHIVAKKVDNITLHNVKDQCNNLGCTPAEYIGNLIEKDLELDYDARDNNENSKDLIIGQSPIPPQKPSSLLSLCSMTEGKQGKMEKAFLTHEDKSLP